MLALRKLCAFLSTGSSEDVFLQLEREVSYNNNVINQLQEEINDLQQMCCILKEVIDGYLFQN